ncbi:putative cytochrome P450 [Rosellinia necatrix]|uniref:Putative cytochrome P450 n=1 Tax=Rosellinia necatrix TaxID=77044 RepID=A0A1W2TIY3_ROSNE|nr:putative cytochrome P450 [Rosellinia necatrix]
MAINILLVTVGVVLSGFAYVYWSGLGMRPKGLPPGPPTLPIIGNIHQLPTSQPHKQFQKWAQEYGPVFSLVLGTQVLIVLSSDVAIKELFDKRSAIYSDRLDMYIGQTLCSGGYRFLMLRYGDNWRMFRKLGHQLLNARASKMYVPYQLLESKQLLYEMLHQPEMLMESFRRYSNSLSTHMIFGWRTTKHDDPRLLQVFEGFYNFGLLAQTGAAAFADFFPVLRRLPDFMVPAKARAKALHRKEMDMYLGLWLEAKRSIEAGTCKACLCADMARQQAAEGFTDEQAAYVAGSFLEAGSDTTAATLYGFVCALLLFPEVQAAAQRELDGVVGASRAPTLDDEPALPYVRACVKEALRWMPTAVLGGVPHATTREDVYLGYRIPAGAGVVNNVYAIHMDPARYADPRAFRPDRFLGDAQSAAEAALNPDPAARDHFVFGSGRRICLGVHVAERSLFIAIARMLWAFEFRPEKDARGNDILPDGETLTEGLAVHPKAFKARVLPRDPARAKMIDTEMRPE